MSGCSGETASGTNTRTRTRRGVLRAGGVGLVALAGCTGSDGGGEARRVSMTDELQFEPRNVELSAGERIRWLNDGSVPHTVTAYEDRIPDAATYFASGGFESERAARNDVRGGLVAEAETYEHTFDVQGTYEYFCVPHEGSKMVGTVRVR